ncbi:hypothetical protein ANCDUO_27143, partial [Ancylostoma duodenale]
MADYGSPNDATGNATPASSPRRSAEASPHDEDYERDLSPRQDSPIGTLSHVSAPSSPVSAHGDDSGDEFRADSPNVPGSPEAEDGDHQGEYHPSSPLQDFPSSSRSPQQADGSVPQSPRYQEDDGDEKRKNLLDSDDSDDDMDEEQRKKKLGNLMVNIFGEDVDEDADASRDAEGDEGEEEGDRAQTGHDEEGYEDDYGDRHKGDTDNAGFEWDFDVMLREKKAERRKKRRKRDTGIDIINDDDGIIAHMVSAMKNAAKDDRHSNTERKPALKKRKMLSDVKMMLLR